MKKKILSLMLVISVILISTNLLPVSANQISVIGSATTSTTTQQMVDIPAGDYHVYIETDGYIGSYGTAYCTASNSTATLFSWSTSLSSDTWTGQITFSSSTTITFTFEIQGSSLYYYNLNFQIVFTDINVSTITKSSIIAEAPYGIGIIGLVLVGMAYVYIKRRRKGY